MKHLSPFNHMKTRNGIYYDLSKSNYRYTMHDTGLVFVFSSDLHLTKFEEQYKDNRHEINLKLSARFRFNVTFKNFPDLVLYRKIETRGFLVFNEGGQKLCQQNLILNGEKAMPKG